jgi:hypothetical protein
MVSILHDESHHHQSSLQELEYHHSFHIARLCEKKSTVYLQQRKYQNPFFDKQKSTFVPWEQDSMLDCRADDTIYPLMDATHKSDVEYLRNIIE